MKKIVVPIVCFLFGILLTTSILYYQIENRYVIGKNAGYLKGAREVFEFLEQNIPTSQSQKYLETGESFGFKYYGIYIIEIDGIRTVKLVK